MFSGSSESAVYNLKLQTRCLAWVPVDEDNEADKQHLLVGTTSLREENEVHVLEYSQSANTLTRKKVLNHPGEIWALVPSTQDPSLFATCYNTGTSVKSTIWRMHGLPDPDAGSGSDGGESEGASDGAGGAGAGAASDGTANGGELKLEEVVELPEHEDAVCNVTFNPHKAGSLLGVHQHSLHAYTLKGGKLKEAGEITIGDAGTPVRKAVWDPLHPKEVCAAVGTGIKGIDVRSMKTTVDVPHAHSHTVRDVGYNPNKPRTVATCGDDCLVKFWDLRKASEPVKRLSGHSHWVWRVAYNRFHDQLVLSSSSDTLVSLWRVSSISSAPLLELDEDAGERPAADALVKEFEEHQDSVYGLDWSYNSAWVFASMSFTGRVAVSHVPPPEMYKILL